MIFNVSLLLALAVLAVGLCWRLWNWLGRDVGDAGPQAGPGQRLKALLLGLAKCFTSPAGLGRLLSAFVLDGLFQRRVFRESRWRWLAHQGVFWGILLLVLLHALEHQITENLFPNYYPTLHPFYMGRDLLGLAVALGLAGFAWRRWRDPVVRRTTKAWDVIILVLLAVIICSGFGLSAVKITSQSRFNEMVAEFGGPEPGPELTALQAYWHHEFGVVFAGKTLPGDSKTLAAGLEAHQSYCADCHSKPQPAVVSWALSRVISPVAGALDSVRADHWLWQVHFLACFLALALLPFTKLLHIFTTPLNLMVEALMGHSGPEQTEADRTAGRAARRALSLDACTSCGTCSQHCSVLAASKVLSSDLALPSLKLAAMGGLASASEDEIALIRLGADLCTRCQRCTRVCPAGIDLQDLWQALDEGMAARKEKTGFAHARSHLVEGQKAGGESQSPQSLTVPGETRDMGMLEMALQYGYFRYCFQCQTCTNVCPVVASYEHPGRALGLLPNQIMYSLELGLVDQAMSAAMTWDCATCYQCQEHCPQKVPVTDLLYELRNQGFWLAGGQGATRQNEGGRS